MLAKFNPLFALLNKVVSFGVLTIGSEEGLKLPIFGCISKFGLKVGRIF